MVSLSTFSFATVAVLSKLSSGVFICCYAFKPDDVPEQHRSHTAETEDTSRPYEFYATCWGGGMNTINVMCGKVEIQRMKHQLEALHVFR
jgi:hypothetical protein